VDNDGSLDLRIWLQQIGSTISAFGLVTVALWNLQLVWRGVRGRFAKLWAALLALAALSILWVLLLFHLISFGTHY
jgi:hypothetical protein